MAEKLCPLKFTVTSKMRLDEVGWNCDEKKCEWWVDGKYQHETGCALPVLARILTVINRVGVKE